MKSLRYRHDTMEYQSQSSPFLCVDKITTEYSWEMFNNAGGNVSMYNNLVRFTTQQYDQSPMLFSSSTGGCCVITSPTSCSCVRSVLTGAIWLHLARFLRTHDKLMPIFNMPILTYQYEISGLSCESWQHDTAACVFCSFRPLLGMPSLLMSAWECQHYSWKIEKGCNLLGDTCTIKCNRHALEKILDDGLLFRHHWSTAKHNSVTWGIIENTLKR